VLIAPILPGLSDRDDQLEEVVAACVDAGAVSISSVALHLRPGVREHYLAWLASARPDLVDFYRRRYEKAYLPAAEQHELAQRVRRMVQRARGRPAREQVLAGRRGPVASACSSSSTPAPTPDLASAAASAFVSVGRRRAPVPAPPGQLPLGLSADS
jgi:DNA repair photolyase